MIKKSLLALATGTFALGIAEFTLMGILGNISNDLGISITEAGHLISAYALGVSIGAPALIVLRRMPLKQVLYLLSAIILAGNFLAAIAPSYGVLLSARFISGLPHGAYFGVASIVAREVANPGREAQAVSIMVAGMSVATLVGVPLGTTLSHTISWRIIFGVVALSGLITLIGVRYWIPSLSALPSSGFKSQFHFLRQPAPWLILFGILLGQGGIYCWYSYIDPLLTQVSGIPVSALTWMMLVAGLGMMVGNLVSGMLADRFTPSKVSAVVAACMVPTLVAIFFLAPNGWLMIPLTFIGTAGLFAIGSPMQYLILKYAKGGEMLGAACIQVAFNVGNAYAAMLGGAVINATQDPRWPALAGAPLALVGAVLYFALHHRYDHMPPSSSSVGVRNQKSAIG